MSFISAIVQAVAGVVTNVNDGANDQYAMATGIGQNDLAYERSKEYLSYGNNKTLTTALAILIIAGLLLVGYVAFRKSS